MFVRQDNLKFVGLAKGGRSLQEWGWGLGQWQRLAWDKGLALMERVFLAQFWAAFLKRLRCDIGREMGDANRGIRLVGGGVPSKGGG